MGIRAVKETARALLEGGRLHELADLATAQRRIMGSLISLTYDPDPLIGWRAVEAMGMAAGRIARDDPDHVRQHLRRLYWLISEESGGQCWRAPEAMAEIVVQAPGQFEEYAAIAGSLLLEMADEDLQRFRPGALWAVGRLAGVLGDHLDDVLPAVTAALDDGDPQARGMAVWCLGQAGRADVLAARPDLQADEGPVDLYEDGSLRRTSVGRLAREVLGS
jgi:methylated-DNA-[protein]-cysteine S-methyltransferase